MKVNPRVGKWDNGLDEERTNDSFSNLQFKFQLECSKRNYVHVVKSFQNKKWPELYFRNHVELWLVQGLVLLWHQENQWREAKGRN